MASLIQDLQTRVTARLSSAESLRSLPILARQPRQTANDIEAAIAQLKLGVFVFPPLIGKVEPNMRSLYANEVEVRVAIFENPILNDSPLSAYDLVERILVLLHQWDPQLTNASPLHARDRSVEDRSDENLVVFDLLFLCSGAFPL
jgi:hypothetical protein